MTETSTHPMMKCGCAAAGTRKIGEEWVPSCVVHDCIEQVETPNLEGRTAICGTHAPQPSSLYLAFFQYRGPSSRDATEICKCGYHQIAHINHPDRIKCKEFTPRGPMLNDLYYCGCKGWD